LARDTRRAFAQAVKAMEPGIRKAFLQAIADVRSTAQFAVIEAAIERGDIQAVINSLRLGREFFAPLDDAIRNAFVQGATYQLASLPKKALPTSGGGPLIVRFQGRNPRAEAWLTEAAGNLIVEILEDQQTVIVEAVRYGLERGQGARTTALDLIGRPGPSGARQGGLVGLHSGQARAVNAARAELNDLDANYFTRKRRDKRFDGTVKRAILDNKPLAQADIARITGRYSDRLLQLRGETIARTETVKAMGAGRREGMQQVIDSGQVPAAAVTRTWDSTGPDGRTRDDHLAMEGQKVSWGVPFIAPDGSRLMGPGDTSLGAPAKQVVACRCYEQISVDFLSLAV